MTRLAAAALVAVVLAAPAAPAAARAAADRTYAGSLIRATLPDGWSFVGPVEPDVGDPQRIQVPMRIRSTELGGLYLVDVQHGRSIRGRLRDAELEGLKPRTIKVGGEAVPYWSVDQGANRGPFSAHHVKVHVPMDFGARSVVLRGGYDRPMGPRGWIAARREEGRIKAFLKSWTWVTPPWAAAEAPRTAEAPWPTASRGAGTRFTTPAYSFEVPGGWRAMRGKAADEVLLYAPGSKTEYIHVSPHPGGKRSLDGAPAWAKRGTASLAGAPARTAVWDTPAGRDAITTVVVQAERGGRTWGVSAVYRRPDGDLVIDRHWNIPMALIVRTWRWSK